MTFVLSPPPLLPVKPVFVCAALGTTVARIYDPTAHYATARTFRDVGPMKRFDHHVETDRSRGILYAAEHMRGCLVELYGDKRAGYTCQRHFCEIPLVRDVTLLDLRGNGAM